jgi:hypothetical protein
VGIAAEIGEHVVGPREGRLAVDDPRLGAEVSEPRGPRAGRGERGQGPGEKEGAPVEGPPQTGEIPAAKDLRQGADGEEKVGPGRNPPASIPGERAPGHDAVHGHMLGEGVAPGVEHGAHTEVAAEMLGIAAERQQRGGGGLKQQAVDQAGVALREGIEGAGEREDDVEVGDREDLGLESEPPPPLPRARRRVHAALAGRGARVSSPAQTPIDEEIAAVLERVHARVQTLLRRRGRLPDEPSPSDPVAEQLPLLAAYAAASIQERGAAGPRSRRSTRSSTCVAGCPCRSSSVRGPDEDAVCKVRVA